MGRRRRPRNPTPQKTNNSIEYLVENEENEYSDRTMINNTNEFSDAQEEIMEEITEKLMENLQDMVNQKVQDALKKYQGTTNEKLEKTQKQLNEVREDFNKLQNETKETIKKR
jgi:DNA anti-recombination protein RmuC